MTEDLGNCSRRAKYRREKSVSELTTERTEPFILKASILLNRSVEKADITETHKLKIIETLKVQEMRTSLEMSIRRLLDCQIDLIKYRVSHQCFFLFSLLLPLSAP